MDGTAGIQLVKVGQRYQWHLMHRPGAGDGPVTGSLARSMATFADEAACRLSAATVWHAPPQDMVCVQEPDGGWRWRLRDADGGNLAESASRFPDARTCRRSALLMQDLLVRVSAQVAPGEQ